MIPKVRLCAAIDSFPKWPMKERSKDMETVPVMDEAMRSSVKKI